MDNELNKTVINTFKIIDVIANTDEPIGISELSRVASLPKTTTFRLVNTLVYLDIVHESFEQTYQLGKLFLKYIDKIKNKNSLVQLAQPFMKKFTYNTRETINLGILYNSQVVYLKSIEGESFSLQVKLMPIAPLYCSSMGKIFLSNFSKLEFDNYVKKSKLEKKTINTISDKDILKADILQVKKSRIAYDNEEAEYGLSCMAVPIVCNNKIIAAISVSGPTSRMKAHGWNQIKVNLVKIGEKISQVVSERS